MEFFEMNFDESFVAKETRVGNGCVQFTDPQIIKGDGCDGAACVIKMDNGYSVRANKPLTNLGAVKKIR